MVAFPWSDPNENNLITHLFSLDALATLTAGMEEIPVVRRDEVSNLYRGIHKTHVKQLAAVGESLEATNEEGRALTTRFEEALEQIAELRSNKKLL
jgi:hydrogenase maturation factor